MPTDLLAAAGQHGGKAEPTTSATFYTNNKLQAAQSASLPPELASALPSCARQCLAGYIEQGWTCSGSNAGCLCSRYSSQGFTLGELAYICLQQECSQSSQDDSLAAYQICKADRNAVTATHSTLTVPARTSTSLGPTSTRAGPGPTSESVTTSRTSQTLSTQRSSSETAASSTGSESTTPTAMASTASTTAAGARMPSGHPTSLSTAQAIGISVACMGVVVLAIGIFYLVVCLRRRRVKVRDEKQERDSYDFVDEAPPRFSPFHYGYADPRGPLGGFYGKRAELTSEKRNSKWYRDNFLAEPAAKYEKGFEYSPKSLQSRSTISQLLPDKPKATPPQLRTKMSPRPMSTVTAPTLFEEDRSPMMYSAMFPPPPPPIGLPSNPKAFHYPKVAKPQQVRYVDQFTQSPVSMRQPSLSIEIPKQAARAVKSPPQAHVPTPHPRHRSPVQREQRVSEARSSRSAASFLNYYASPEADNLRSPESPTPIDDNIQTRRAVPTAITVTKPTYPPRAVRVTSAGSDTSFESTDPDEPTPPEEEDKQLTPVKEHSPIAGIKYPKVPRSSNQAIPRSPPIGAKGSPSIGAKISPAPKQTRMPNALPAGAHAISSPRQIQDPARALQAQQLAQQPRPVSNIPRKPVPSYQPPQQQPVTPERQLNKNSNLSGSTLAAKRRGDTDAHDLEQNLHIKDSAHSKHSGNNAGLGIDKPLPPPVSATRRSPHNSPLKGYGRVASRNNSPVATRPPGLPQGQPPQQAQRRIPVRPAEGPTGYRQPGSTAAQQHSAANVEPPLKSPAWEPKLTPSRKGEDLYLSVGSATPRTEAFAGGSTEYRGRGI